MKFIEFIEPIWNSRKNDLPPGSSVLLSSLKSFGGKEEGLSVQGAGHIKNNVVCQDYGGHYVGNGYVVAVVCDGHGSKPYFRSDRGSRFGVECLLASVRESMSCKKEFINSIKRAACKAEISVLHRDGERKIKKKEQELIDAFQLESLDDEQLQIYASGVMDQLIRNIILKWNTRVIEDRENDPFTEEELDGIEEKYKEKYKEIENTYSAYGTTLIAVVIAPEFWFGIRIGDGKCVAISADGSIKDPIPWDEQCFLNITTSMSDSKAFVHFKKCFHATDFPVAVYVGTDGVDDSYGNDERLFDFYKSLTLVFAEKGFEQGIHELKEFLPQLTARGSGDDISISGIIDLNAIQQFITEKTIKESTIE